MDNAGYLAPLRYARLWYSMAYALLAFVAIVSLIPAPQIEASDKLLHVMTYAVLSAVFSSLVCQSYSLLKVVSGLILYGAVLELLQGFTGYRYMELYDMLANTIGVFIGLSIRLTALPRWLRQIESLLD